MKFTAAAALALGLASSAAAAATGIEAHQVIEAIAPNTKSCDGAEKPDQCRTSVQIASPIVAAMWHYGIINVNQIAAVLALTAFESVDYKFNRNVFPGRPGQGSSNMQMKQFNLEYAKSIPELSAQFSGFASADAMSDADLDALLTAVTDDKYNFGTGPWFLATKCTADVRAQLETSPDQGFNTYMTTCVGVEVTEDRLAYWNRAKAVFGIA